MAQGLKLAWLARLKGEVTVKDRRVKIFTFGSAKYLILLLVFLSDNSVRDLGILAAL